MKKTLLVFGVLGASLLLTGCGQKDSTSLKSNTQPNNQTATDSKKQSATANPTTAQNSLELTAPQTTNDLPTAIKETETDLKVIENDLNEIDKMDLSEESLEL